MNNTIKIKRERPSIVKTESEIDNAPFESSLVQCHPKIKNQSNHDNFGLENMAALKTEIEAIKSEKEKLIEELVVTKRKNQTIYFNYQSSQKMIETLQCERNELKEKLNAQNKQILQITREKNACQTKINQLMASTSVKIVREEVEPHKEYEVEAILNHKGRKGQRQYLIRWKNYSPNHDSWEKESNLNCDAILKEYLHAKGL